MGFDVADQHKGISNKITRRQNEKVQFFLYTNLKCVAWICDNSLNLLFVEPRYAALKVEIFCGCFFTGYVYLQTENVSANLDDEWAEFSIEFRPGV